MSTLKDLLSLKSDNFLATKLVLMLASINLIARLFLTPMSLPPSPDHMNAIAATKMGEMAGELWNPFILSGMPMSASLMWRDMGHPVVWLGESIVGLLLIFASLLIDGYGRWTALALSLPAFWVIANLSGGLSGAGLQVFPFAMMVLMINYRKLGWQDSVSRG